MNSPLKPSQLIHVLVTVAGRTYAGEARIIEVGPGSMLITVPSRQGIPLSVPSDHVSVTVPMPNEAVTMRCRVLKASDRAVLLALPEDTDAKRVQRRRFVRVTTDLPCTIRGDRNVIGMPLSPAPGRLIDLSEGGGMILIGRELAVGSMLKVSVTLPSDGQVELFGRVKRCLRERRGFGPTFLAGLEFMNDQAVRTRVVHYVRQVQLKLKQHERSA